MVKKLLFLFSVVAILIGNQTAHASAIYDITGIWNEERIVNTFYDGTLDQTWTQYHTIEYVQTASIPYDQWTNKFDDNRFYWSGYVDGDNYIATGPTNASGEMWWWKEMVSDTGTTYWAYNIQDSYTFTMISATEYIGVATGYQSGWYYIPAIEEARYSEKLSLYSWTAYYTGTAAPVPEPATIILFSTGLVGLVGFGRKKFIKR